MFLLFVYIFSTYVFVLSIVFFFWLLKKIINKIKKKEYNRKMCLTRTGGLNARANNVVFLLGRDHDSFVFELDDNLRGLENARLAVHLHRQRRVRYYSQLACLSYAITVNTDLQPHLDKNKTKF